MILLKLFWSFIKIGFTSFGGLSMLSLISDEMISHGWMTLEQVSDIVAIAEMTPGPLGLNCATFAGIQVAGMPGAFFAVLGALTPSLTLAFAAAAFFDKFRRSRVIDAMLVGIRPTCVGMVCSVMLTLTTINYASASGPNFVYIAIGLICLFLLTVVKLSIPAVLGVSAILGLINKVLSGLPPL